MRLIIVGASGPTRELMRRLGEIWEITLVDRSREQLEKARPVRHFREVVGDGCSRLVLEKAGLAEAEAVVAATGDDDVNLEICRLARESGILRILGLVNDPERNPAFRALQVRSVATASLVARQAEVSLESRRVASKAFADGKAEAIELRVAHDSPVRGRTLREIHAQDWIVGAVLRRGQLIVPHGDTVLEKGDLVTVIGPGAQFGQIIRTFTSGEPRFPLHHGKRIALVVDEEADLAAALAEAEYLARNSRAMGLLLVHRDPELLREGEAGERVRGLLARADSIIEGVEIRPRAVRGSPARALAELPAEESIGMVVLPAPAGPERLRGRGVARRALSLVRRRGVPVLLSRRSHPYGHILLPARRTDAGRAAARVAIDLARFTKARMIGLAALDPVFSGGESDQSAAEEAVGWLTEEAAAQGVDVHGSVRSGNPVHTFLADAARADLLVLGVGGRVSGLLRVDVISHLVRRAPCSVLLVPSES